MATTATEILASIDTGIATVLSKIASGDTITEWQEGPVRVKKSSAHELLAELRRMRQEFAPGAEDRQAGYFVHGGRQ